MKWQGWLFLILSWSVILGLLTFCLYRILRPRQARQDSSKPQPHDSSENA